MRSPSLAADSVAQEIGESAQLRFERQHTDVFGVQEPWKKIAPHVIVSQADQTRNASRGGLNFEAFERFCSRAVKAATGLPIERRQGQPKLHYDLAAGSQICGKRFGVSGRVMMLMPMHFHRTAQFGQLQELVA